MDVSQIIEQAFPGSNRLSVDLDLEIRENANPMEIPGSQDPLVLIPAYMQWVIRNRHNYDQLVTDWTLNAVAEYGRAKADAKEHMKFKLLCSQAQRQAVCKFLEWSLSALLVVHEEQVKRAIKHWC